jgi:hypothetical protein
MVDKHDFPVSSTDELSVDGRCGSIPETWRIQSDQFAIIRG